MTTREEVDKLCKEFNPNADNINWTSYKYEDEDYTQEKYKYGNCYLHSKNKDIDETFGTLIIYPITGKFPNITDITDFLNTYSLRDCYYACYNLRKYFTSEQLIVPIAKQVAKINRALGITPKKEVKEKIIYKSINGIKTDSIKFIPYKDLKEIERDDNLTTSEYIKKCIELNWPDSKISYPAIKKVVCQVYGILENTFQRRINQHICNFKDALFMKKADRDADESFDDDFDDFEEDTELNNDEIKKNMEAGLSFVEMKTEESESEPEFYSEDESDFYLRCSEFEPDYNKVSLTEEKIKTIETLQKNEKRREITLANNKIAELEECLKKQKDKTYDALEKVENLTNMVNKFYSVTDDFDFIADALFKRADDLRNKAKDLNDEADSDVKLGNLIKDLSDKIKLFNFK